MSSRHVRKGYLNEQFGCKVKRHQQVKRIFLKILDYRNILVAKTSGLMRTDVTIGIKYT